MNIAAKRSLIGLLIAIILFSITAFPVTKSLLNVWYNDTSFYHGFIVIPLFFVGCLLKPEIFDIYPIRFEPLTIPILAITSTLMMIMFFGGFNIIAHFLFAICLILIVLAAFGRHIIGHNKGLVFFLLFTIPLGTEFVIPLQNLTADISVFLLKLSGVSATYEGIHIITPNASFYVAEACAGLRFLITNIFVCYIFAYLNLKKNKSWFIFGCISVTIPIIGNCLRAYLIMMIGHYTNGEYAAGIDHLIYGWGFFSFLAFINLLIGDKIANSEGFIETETAPLLPFGVYDATRDKFYPYYHFYEKRIFLSFIIILLIPISLNQYFTHILDMQKDALMPNLSHISPIKFDEKNAISKDLITDFKNADYQITYGLDETTSLQISYHTYQNAHKEVTSSINTIHNEDNRLLLSQGIVKHQNNTYNMVVTGYIDGQQYLTLSTYFYQSGRAFKHTNSKIEMQLKSLVNLLYYGKNAGGIIIIDKALHHNETPQQATDTLLKMMQ